MSQDISVQSDFNQKGKGGQQMEDLSRNWGRACEVNSNALIKRNEDYIIYLVTFNSIFLENSLSTLEIASLFPLPKCMNYSTTLMIQSVQLYLI